VAVYTHISAEDMSAIVECYGVGTLVSAKGIAEGVENSNYMVDTTVGRFILTVYEKRVDPADLPFFMGLLDHLAGKNCPVPRTMHLADGGSVAQWQGKNIALIEYLPGVSVSRPNAKKAHAVGIALGKLHLASSDFAITRENTLGPDGWFDLAARCGAHLDDIQVGLKERVDQECRFIQAHWPHDLPKSIIHADMFPDNVLMQGDDVGGIIDFYFACNEIRAWDLAVTHVAWSFSAGGDTYLPHVGAALIAGYEESFGLSPQERDAFNVLARGACLRFLLTRSWDWINTPADAVVKRHDPLAMLGRLEHYASL
jgi:homoserine kinase type II